VHVLAYWLARVALMFVVFFALWGLGWTPWFAVLAAAVIAWLISYAMFGAMHDAAARQMETWLSRRFVGVARDETAEDAEASVDHTPGAGARVAARAGTASKRVAAASSKPVGAPPAKRPETPAKRSV